MSSAKSIICFFFDTIYQSLNETLHLAHLVTCLYRYLRRALIGILQQVQNGIDIYCISFLLENLIDLLLRSAHLYQDGGQVLAVLRTAFTAVENCRQPEDDSTICEQDGMSRSNTISVCLQYVLNEPK